MNINSISNFFSSYFSFKNFSRVQITVIVGVALAALTGLAVWCIGKCLKKRSVTKVESDPVVTGQFKKATQPVTVDQQTSPNRKTVAAVAYLGHPHEAIRISDEEDWLPFNLLESLPKSLQESRDLNGKHFVYEPTDFLVPIHVAGKGQFYLPGTLLQGKKEGDVVSFLYKNDLIELKLNQNQSPMCIDETIETRFETLKKHCENWDHSIDCIVSLNPFKWYFFNPKTDFLFKPTQDEGNISLQRVDARLFKPLEKVKKLVYKKADTRPYITKKDEQLDRLETLNPKFREDPKVLSECAKKILALIYGDSQVVTEKKLMDFIQLINDTFAEKTSLQAYNILFNACSERLRAQSRGLLVSKADLSDAIVDLLMIKVSRDEWYRFSRELPYHKQKEGVSHERKDLDPVESGAYNPKADEIGYLSRDILSSDKGCLIIADVPGFKESERDLNCISLILKPEHLLIGVQRETIQNLRDNPTTLREEQIDDKGEFGTTTGGWNGLPPRSKAFEKVERIYWPTYFPGLSFEQMKEILQNQTLLSIDNGVLQISIIKPGAQTQSLSSSNSKEEA